MGRAEHSGEAAALAVFVCFPYHQPRLRGESKPCVPINSLLRCPARQCRAGVNGSGVISSSESAFVEVR